MTKAYLLGALHDGTVRKLTYRIVQKDQEYIEPSKNVDPNYWRFFISIKSYEKFAKVIGSWHPIKSHFLRMKI